MSRHTLVTEQPEAIVNATLAADRSGSISVNGANQITLFVEYKHHSSITDLEIVPELNRQHGSTTYYRLPEEEVTAPPVVNVNVLTGRRYNVDLTSLVSGTTYYFCLFIPVAGAQDLKVTVDQTGAAAAATIAIYGARSVQ